MRRHGRGVGMSTESMPEQDVPSAAPYTAQEIRQVLAEGGEITHLMAEDVLAEVDSLTRQRDEAQAEARANRAAYRAACWRDQAGRCELDTAQTTIARVEALWADNAVGREGGGSYISPDELRAAIDGSALSAVTAPPEPPETVNRVQPHTAAYGGPDDRDADPETT